jgi:hypothetical protein
MIKMKKVGRMIFALAVSLALVLPMTAHVEAAGKFKDVPANHWAAKIIDDAVAKGIVAGFSDGTFRPDDIVSSDQLLVMLFNSFKSTYTSNGKTVTEWDRTWLRKLGNDRPWMFNSFNNGETISRFEFKGASTGYWAKPYVDFAYAMKFLDSFDVVYPHDYDVFKKPVTRERASYLFGEWIYRYEGLCDSQYVQFAKDHADVVDLNDFTPSAISAHKMDVMLAGIMRGWNNHFYPQRYVTRAEALTMVMELRYPEKRNPFKPDLTGQYYTVVDGRISMFSDKTKYEYYNKIVALAKDTVKTGYVAIGTLGTAVYSSKDAYDESLYDIKIGHLDEAPKPEFGVAVGFSKMNYVGISYDPEHNFPNGGKFFDAALDLLSDGKGAELKSTLFASESKVTSKPVEFTVNGRNFSLSWAGSSLFLQYNY